MNTFLIGIGTVIVTYIIRPLIQKAIHAVRVWATTTLKEKADVYLKDPVIRAAVLEAIAKVEKMAGEPENQEKLRAAVNELKKTIPGIVDDIILEIMVEAILAEIRGQPIKTNSRTKTAITI